MWNRRNERVRNVMTKNFETFNRVLMKSELIGADTDVETDITNANIITSKCADQPGKHRPVLDIDFGARLIPSTQDGRFHLYLDNVVLDDANYRLLLITLSAVGIISQAYANHSLRRGYTAVRLPWVKKQLGDGKSDD